MGNVYPLGAPHPPAPVATTACTPSRRPSPIPQPSCCLAVRVAARWSRKPGRGGRWCVAIPHTPLPHARVGIQAAGLVTARRGAGHQEHWPARRRRGPALALASEGGAGRQGARTCASSTRPGVRTRDHKGDLQAPLVAGARGLADWWRKRVERRRLGTQGEGLWSGDGLERLGRKESGGDLGALGAGPQSHKRRRRRKDGMGIRV
jgi:hypothetical protein